MEAQELGTVELEGPSWPIAERGARNAKSGGDSLFAPFLGSINFLGDRAAADSHVTCSLTGCYSEKMVVETEGKLKMPRY